MAGKRCLRLTDAPIARLRSDAREYTVWHTRTPGLGVRVRPTGGKSFILLHKTDGRSRRTSLGPAALRSVDAVRRDCHALIAERPTDAAMRPRAPLFRDFVAGPWREAHFPKYKLSTRKQTSAALANQLLPAFGATALERITSPASLSSGGSDRAHHSSVYLKSDHLPSGIGDHLALEWPITLPWNE